MAEQARRATWDAQTRPFGIQDLLRLAVWGLLAAAALGLAVISISSGAGSQRLSGTGPRPAPGAVENSAALTAVASELRRLQEAVQTLSAERDQMRARIASLEHGLDDVTGTIKREANTPAARAETPGPSNGEGSPPQAPGEGNPAAVVEGPASATSAVAARPNPPAEPLGLGIDVGGALTFGVRENKRTHTPDLRLILGPLAGAEAAAGLCTALAAARHYCQPVPYEGQRLSFIEPAPKGTSSAVVSAAPAGPGAPAHHAAPAPLRP